MNNPEISLSKFRKEYNISSDFIRSTCKILGIEVLKKDKDQYIPLVNEALGIGNDEILVFADLERKSTGKIELTKRKEFNIDILDGFKKESRSNYVFLSNDEQEMQITKKPKESIDITSSSIDVRREEFISLLAEVVSKSVSANSRSVLNTQEELQKAMEKKWLLTNEQLGSLLGMSKSTIGSKADGWVRMGFKYTKIKEGAMTLWRVSQYDLP